MCPGLETTVPGHSDSTEDRTRARELTGELGSDSRMAPLRATHTRSVMPGLRASLGSAGVCRGAGVGVRLAGSPAQAVWMAQLAGGGSGPPQALSPART